MFNHPKDEATIATVVSEFAHITIHFQKEICKLMADFTALNASVAKLQADVAALIAKASAPPPPPPDEQPAVDAVTSAVNAIDASVIAAAPPAS